MYPLKFSFISELAYVCAGMLIFVFIIFYLVL